ncbi:MAG: type II 3-dehydroquinate dehydratase [Acidimicrobiales bacterium]
MGREEGPARPELTVVPGRQEVGAERPAGEPEDYPSTSPATFVLLLSGPNLGLLGQRQPEVYGRDTLAEHVARATLAAAEHGLAVKHVQSDYEGALVEAVQGARGRAAAVVVNPGALTHYSWSLHDALAGFDGPVVELHLSSPGGREPWRRLSVVTPVATGVIAGFGGEGYRLAIEAVAALLRSGHR